MFGLHLTMFVAAQTKQILWLGEDRGFLTKYLNIFFFVQFSKIEITNVRYLKESVSKCLTA